MKRIVCVALVCLVAFSGCATMSSITSWVQASPVIQKIMVDSEVVANLIVQYGPQAIQWVQKYLDLVQQYSITAGSVNTLSQYNKAKPELDSLKDQIDGQVVMLNAMTRPEVVKLYHTGSSE